MSTKTFVRPKPFSSRVYNFVRDVIRHRNILMSRQLSTTNKMKTLRIIEELMRMNNKTYNERAAGRFFILRADDILYIIKQDDHEKNDRFRELLEKSKIYSRL